MDMFMLHHKILSACEYLMNARRIIERMTNEEKEAAVSVLEQLCESCKDNQGGQRL